MIGVVVAMPPEAFAVFGRKGWLPLKTNLSIFSYQQVSATCLVVQSGLGLARAEEAAQWLLSQGVKALVSLGISGGLIEDLATGGLLLADTFTGREREFKADVAGVARCSAALERTALNWRCGKLVSVEQAVLSPAAKLNLAEKSGALAVDMESAAVALVAEMANLPYFALRSVCDTVSQEVGLDPARILTKEGQVKVGRLVTEIVQRPSLLLVLPGLGKDFNVALAALKQGWHVLEGEFERSR